jgi:hypothetical protein
MECRYLKVAIVSLMALLVLLFVAVLAQHVTPMFETGQTEVQGQFSARTDSLTIGDPQSPAGFTMYDASDGRAYCVYLSGGNLLPILGTCEQTDARLLGR